MCKLNEASKDMEGVYTLCIKGNKITITDKDKNVGVARCAPEDAFEYDQGIPMAFGKMLEAKQGIHEGDKVVVNPAFCYNFYSDWVDEYITDSKLRTKYAFGSSPRSDKMYKVIKIAFHLNNKNLKLAYVQAIDFAGRCYVVEYKTLKKVEE